MKRVVSSAVLVVAAALVISSPAFADETPTFADRPSGQTEDFDRSLSLMLNPVSIAQGVFGAEADLVLNPRLAIAIEGDISRPSSDTELGLGVGLLVYPFTPALHGGYVSIRAGYVHSVSDSLTRFDSERDVAMGSAIAGWQWTWDYGFSLRFGGGAAVFAGPPAAFESGWVTAGRFALVTDTSLGWAW